MHRFTSCLMVVMIYLLMLEARGDRINLRYVKDITLYQHQRTASRRTSAVPQLKCVGGTAGPKCPQPKMVRCYNRGWDGQDAQWECKAEMDTRYKFGKVKVLCEGYDFPDDPYILTGSCGLEYELDYARWHDHYYPLIMSVMLLFIIVCLVGCLADSCPRRVYYHPMPTAEPRTTTAGVNTEDGPGTRRSGLTGQYPTASVLCTSCHIAPCCTNVHQYTYCCHRPQPIRRSCNSDGSNDITSLPSSTHNSTGFGGTRRR